MTNTNDLKAERARGATGIEAAQIRLSAEQYARFGKEQDVGRHGYHQLPLFDDASLEALLDEYPLRRLQVYTMGSDPACNTDWKYVDVARGTSGADILKAVRNGRLWVNLTHIERLAPRIGVILDELYEHLGDQCPHLEQPRSLPSALLISSPGAQVYYHLDADAALLLHLRGEKRFWLYPAMDPELAPQELLEDIYAGDIDETLPYRADFDKQATEHLLKPGDLISWPHNGPHRIENIDMNVSLATSYTSRANDRRRYVQLANRHLLRPLGIKQRSMAEEGVLPATKRLAYRVLNRVRPFQTGDRSRRYMTDLQLDGESCNGLRRLPEPRYASFSSMRASETFG